MFVPAPASRILIYQPEDGKTRVAVRVEEESVWLAQGQMAEHWPRLAIPAHLMYISFSKLAGPLLHASAACSIRRAFLFWGARHAL